MKREPDFVSNENKLCDKSGRQRCFRGVVFCFLNNSTQSSLALPLSLENIDTQLSQLVQKGVNLIALQIFWKNIEPDVPEEYNEEYLAQLRLLLKKVEEYDISVIIQPVMGSWGAGTEYDGCPAWTLKLIGLEPDASYAFFQDDISFAENNPNTKVQIALFQKYLTSTMYTLFWAGKTFAPDILIDGDNIQDYLQERYISAMKHTARRIKDCDAVIGMSFMSRGEVGFIGISDLQKDSDYVIPAGKEKIIFNTSPFEIIKNASGLQGTYKIPQKIKLGLITPSNQYKTSLWQGGFSSENICPWQKVNIWHQTEDKEAILDEAEYFALKTKDSFVEDYLKPFQKNFFDAFQKKHGRYLFLSEKLVDGTQSSWEYGNELLHKKIEAVEKEGGVIPEYDPEAIKIILGYEINSLETASFPMELEALGSCAPFFLLNFFDSVKIKGGVKTDLLSHFFDFIDKKNYSFLLDTNFTLQNQGQLPEEIATEISRPYIQSLWGSLINFSFKKKPAATIEIEWMSLPQSLEEINSTEIFIPDSFFTKGWKVEKFDGVGTVTCQPEKQTLLITTVTEQRCTLRIISK